MYLLKLSKLHTADNAMFNLGHGTESDFSSYTYNQKLRK